MTDPESLAGTHTLSGYALERLLGVGGFGAVYLGRNALGRTRAIKVPHDPGALADVLEEARALDALCHEAIVQIENVVLDDPAFPHLVVEHVEGTPVRELVGAGLTAEQVEDLVRQVLTGLDHAHTRGVLHLDLKPDNLIRTPEGRIKILDFGLGRRLVDPERLLQSLTRSAAGAAGTLAYMAPEQREGLADLDGRTDLFALAVTSFELCNGRPPAGNARLKSGRGGLDAFFAAAYVDAREDRVPSARQALAQLSPPPAKAEAEAVAPAARPPRMTYRKGWAGEPLPDGLLRSKAEGVYVWEGRPEASLELVYVPPGRFRMGDDEGDADERPSHVHDLAHRVYVGRTPVTFAQYLAFCRATGRAKPKAPKFGQRADHPAVNVSWEDALAACAWWGLHLPSEPEWEKAARGAGGQTYPWGEEPPSPERAAFSRSRTEGTLPAGSLAAGASPFGALDMAGNVWEWVEDLYEEDAYARYAEGDRSAPATGKHGMRVLRGGSWLWNAQATRAANRYWNTPRSRGDEVGFRVALRLGTRR